MCEVCEALLESLPPKTIPAFESFMAEAEALGAKIVPLLIEAGFMKINERIHKEEKANEKDERAIHLLGLSALTGFTVGASYHDAGLVHECNRVLNATTEIGWATGHQAEVAIKN